MTAEHIVTATAVDSSANDSEAKTLHLTEARRQVGLEAVWEIAALCQGVRDAAKKMADDHDDGPTLYGSYLLIRGLTARLDQMTNVALAILDDPRHSTSDLHRVVHNMLPIA